MFAAALIVFRETLEAALLIGVICAATRGLARRNAWVALGIGAGLAGSLAVAGLTEVIANAAEGSGQELFNAAVLGVAVLMLAWHSIWMSVHGRELAAAAQAVGARVREGGAALSAIAVVIALTVLREGSETVLFLYGTASAGQTSLLDVAAGGCIGLAGGAALGAVIYLGLLRVPLRWFFTVTNALLLLLAAGLASQMARFLVQADLLPALATPLWDTSAWLPVDHLLGATLHVLTGYDATPSGMQAVFYVVTLAVIGLGTWLVRGRAQGTTPAPTSAPTPTSARERTRFQERSQRAA